MDSTSGRRADEVIAELAARQHGVVARRQLLAAGLSPGLIQARVAARRLLPVHRGVYQVGPLTPPRQKEMAAALVGGRGGVVSHRSAASLWEILPGRSNATRVDITVPGADRGRRPGIRPHRVHRLEPDEVAIVDGVPVTTPARTVLDLAGVVSFREMEQALARAERRDLLTREELESLLDRYPKRAGSQRIRALLRAETGPAFTRSEAEERFLTLVRKARLPEPETNVVVAGYELDFLWCRQRLAAEIDGYAFHSSKRTFERDRRRDVDLAARGIQVLRMTWRQIVKEPEAALVRLAQALAVRPA